MRFAFVLTLLAAQISFAAPTAEQIRQIVRHQQDSPRAMANLVQLTRDLDDATSAQLFLDIADDFLAEGKYNQAADFLQQLTAQHPSQSAAREGALRLTQLYSSSEVQHTQREETNETPNHPAFCSYALHVANGALQKDQALATDPAFTFQRAAAARGAGSGGVASNLLTTMKHDRAAKAWHARARTEQWLAENRQGKAPLPVVVCRRAAVRPHLDGALTDAAWNATDAVQFAYDDEFCYFAARFPKQSGVDYAPDPRPRTHDADLSAHDSLRLRLDLDRDYSTCFELAVDHRGWTADRCWHDATWNPKWFVAAASDASHWSVEAALPWGELTSTPPTASSAWAIAIERVSPTKRAEASPPIEKFAILIFE